MLLKKDLSTAVGDRDVMGLCMYVLVGCLRYRHSLIAEDGLDVLEHMVGVQTFHVVVTISEKSLMFLSSLVEVETVQPLQVIVSMNR